MAPFAPVPVKNSSFGPLAFAPNKKKLVDALSSKPKSDIAAPSKTDKKASTVQTYNWQTAPSPFTTQNAPKTIGALFGGGVTSEQTAPTPATPTPTPLPMVSQPSASPSTTEQEWKPIPFGVEAANASENLFNTYMSDPTISDSGKKALKDDLDK